MTELNYANIQADLGTFMHSILTQCANMDEIEVFHSEIVLAIPDDIWSNMSPGDSLPHPRGGQCGL